MSNKAAVVEQIGSPVVIKTVEKYAPGPDEILVKNGVISFNPLEVKMQKFGAIPYSVPAILGFSSAGTVEAVGTNVSYVKPGDRVAVLAPFDLTDLRTGHFQEYYIAFPRYTSKIPDSVSLEDASSVPSNLVTVVAVFDAMLGPERPSPDGKRAAPKGKKLLVYGGSSSVGGYAIKYASDLGYEVITTSSPQNQEFVTSLGASSVVDHRQPAEKIVADLKALGPFDAVFDAIGTPEPTAIIGQVLAETGGGTIFTTLPQLGDTAAYAKPDSVNRVYDSWPQVLDREEQKALLEWTYHVYIPEGLRSGAIIPTRNFEVPGGIDGIQEILDKSLVGGVSGKRLITHV
ncbi:alcohol dehydrogenase [Lasiodiplodia theobromae]|uniref:alcohol dehydrogenase n=1 Tax=Lasiodiplodia theobromae TaxID=45133 RepID=UPI0015C36D9D|nr:alcohol dehydrogenase [Lasiodiplodia theobromae]KAF4545493.1 alcohol dehydrogenase [Lasiodiplodia theobromae]